MDDEDNGHRRMGDLHPSKRMVACFFGLGCDIVDLAPLFSFEEDAEPAATAQRGQPSVFGRFTGIRNSILARPAWLI